MQVKTLIKLLQKHNGNNEVAIWYHNQLNPIRPRICFMPSIQMLHNYVNIIIPNEHISPEEQETVSFFEQVGTVNEYLEL